MKMNHWRQLMDLLPQSDENIDQGSRLFDDFITNGPLRLTSEELLRIPLPSFLQFYFLLLGEGLPSSPVAGNKDSSWMRKSDFSYFNVRATGVDGTRGHFLQAAKLLPSLRVNAIHLGPFTVTDFDSPYAVRSVRSIDRNAIDPELAKVGFTAEMQLNAFVEAVHGLKMAVGFDIEPHTSQFSNVVLHHPSWFRWIRVSANRKTLMDGLTMEEILEPEMQKTFAGEVDQIVKSCLNDQKINTLEFLEPDSTEIISNKEQVRGEIIGTLIDAGYWTIPNQSWAGIGIPAFNGYNRKRNFARFDYRDSDGKNQAKTAYHVLTPFAFYDNVPVNRMADPKIDDPPVPRKDVIEGYSAIFTYWRDTFQFDFIRHDSADQVFNSLYPDTEYPSSDRTSPDVLRACINKSRQDAPWIGNMAERMGVELDDFAPLGFDLLLGEDMLRDVDRELIENSFDLEERLILLNRDRPIPFSVVFALDTHDTGALRGKSIVQDISRERMVQRHFVSRFLPCGSAIRPKYEVMGLPDRSYGLPEANNRLRNLTWIGDKIYLAQYHFLEEAYEWYEDFLESATLIEKNVNDKYASWILQSGSWALIALLSLDRGKQKRYQKPLENISIDFRRIVKGKNTLSLKAFDFNNRCEKSVTCRNGVLAIETLEYLHCHLYVLDQKDR